MRRIVLIALVWGCGGKDDGDDDRPGDDDDDTVAGDDDDDDATVPPGQLTGGRVCTARGWCWETPSPPAVR